MADEPRILDQIETQKFTSEAAALAATSTLTNGESLLALWQDGDDVGLVVGYYAGGMTPIVTSSSTWSDHVLTGSSWDGENIILEDNDPSNTNVTITGIRSALKIIDNASFNITDGLKLMQGTTVVSSIPASYFDFVKSVNGKTGIVVLNKSDIELGNVDNTADLNKPISIATQTAFNALNTRIDTNDGSIQNIESDVAYLQEDINTNQSNITLLEEANATLSTTIDTKFGACVKVADLFGEDGKIKSEYLPELAGGEHIQADWDTTDADDPAFIKNKPTIQFNVTSYYADVNDPNEGKEIKLDGDADTLRIRFRDDKKHVEFKLGANFPSEDEDVEAYIGSCPYTGTSRIAWSKKGELNKNSFAEDYAPRMGKSDFMVTKMSPENPITMYVRTWCYHYDIKLVRLKGEDKYVFITTRYQHAEILD
jgi:hypothetical protein